MAEVVPWPEIEERVGAQRGVLHKARLLRPDHEWGDEEWTLTILHGWGCHNTRGYGNPEGGKPDDLLDCPYTIAMDTLLYGRWFHPGEWQGLEGVPVVVRIVMTPHDGEILVPAGRARESV